MKASEIQKERIAEIENKADLLLKEVQTATLSSINENGYPRTCIMTKAGDNGFHEVYFITSKRSQLQGKATHFENNTKASVCYFKGADSVTLIGEVEFVEDEILKEKLWLESDRRFFSKGIADPKFRLLKFTTLEATFWIEGKFRTCKYRKVNL
ncbi:MAG: pyridoxamine 5'-phosphate oxidase family protein [Mobilitalea sp.]